MQSSVQACGSVGTLTFCVATSNGVPAEHAVVTLLNLHCIALHCTHYQEQAGSSR